MKISSFNSQCLYSTNNNTSENKQSFGCKECDFLKAHFTKSGLPERATKIYIADRVQTIMKKSGCDHDTAARMLRGIIVPSFREEEDNVFMIASKVIRHINSRIEAQNKTTADVATGIFDITRGKPLFRYKNPSGKTPVS